MESILFFVLLPMLAIVSSWAFGAMMELLSGWRGWRPARAFWVSAITYCLLGFVIPVVLLQFGYSDSYYLWIFGCIGAGLIWIIGFFVLKLLERRRVRFDRSAGQEQASEIRIPNGTVTDGAKSAKQISKPAIPVKAARIFISYRRTDSADIAGRIYDRLIAKFGRDAVFKDVDSIPLGLDFKEYLDKQVGECNVLLTIIGDQWIQASDPSGSRRLEDSADFVRIEIESALARGIPVIPLLVRGAQMPSETSLPPSLRKLVYRNGIPIRSDPDFHRDMDRLIAGLENYVK